MMVLLGCGLMAHGQRADSAGSNAFSRLMLSYGTGAAIVNGAARESTQGGAQIMIGVGVKSRPWLGYLFDYGLLFQGLPKAVAQQGQVPSGQTDFQTFTLDPILKLGAGRRWGVYATGGGGMSWKRVTLLQTGGYCSDAYGCNTPVSSASTWQPAVDGGGGVTYRVQKGRPLKLMLESRYIKMFTPQGPYPGFAVAGTGEVMLSVGARL